MPQHSSDRTPRPSPRRATLARALFLIALLLPAASGSAAAQIEVLFTRPVDTSLASSPSNHARYESDVSAVVASRLLTATATVDVAMYNLNVQRVVDALIALHRRGVRVRVIGNIENISNPNSRFSQLSAVGIPVASNPRGPSGQPQPLMHNKFIIIDGRSGSSAAPPTTITGSWNATTAQTYEDPNNVVIIRDSAIAGAYRAEFEEMWGSSTDAPNPSAARFSSNKRENTDHVFTLSDGTRVEVWFSPSDRVESRIRDAISSAQTSIYTANLTITSSTLAGAIATQKSRFGADARVLIENVDDQGGQFGFLSAAVETISTATLPGQLHHKYGIMDAIPIGTGSVPQVVTGSHNWTYSANTINDENTLVIYSASIANQFLQEFAARYREAGGTRPFGVSASVDADEPRSGASPNPFVDVITLPAASRCDARVSISDILGRVVATTVLSAGERRLDVGAVTDADGMLIIRIVDCDGAHNAVRVLRER